VVCWVVKAVGTYIYHSALIKGKQQETLAIIHPGPIIFRRNVAEPEKRSGRFGNENAPGGNQTPVVHPKACHFTI
jgi:hypothetical protein